MSVGTFEGSTEARPHGDLQKLADTSGLLAITRGNKVTGMALSQQLCPPSNLQASGEEPVYRLGWMDGLFIGLYLPACGVLRGTQGGWGRVIVWRKGH